MTNGFEKRMNEVEKYSKEAPDNDVIMPKQMGGQRTAPGRKPGAVYFPRNPLTRVLPIPKAIWEQNAGNPFDILDVAKAVGMSPTSSTFIQLLASSYRYGLTEGSPSTKIISLTPLGSSIVAPTYGVDVKAKLREALLFSEIFRKVYTWMDRKPIPRDDVFRNTLMKPSEAGGFGIPKEYVDDFVKVFMQNISDYHLADELQGTRYLRLDKLSSAPLQTILPPKGEYEEGLQETVIEEGVGEREAPSSMSGQVVVQEEKTAPKQIFVAHGKNKRPLEQLEKILNRFKVPYRVAEEEAHRGRPVGQKVADLMRQCTSGIFIFTADEETQDMQGNKIYTPSDNVVYELGAASVLYGEKIVILKENEVSFASDFGDLAYISFEKDKLDLKAADLMVEFIGLGFLELRPT